MTRDQAFGVVRESGRAIVLAAIAAALSIAVGLAQSPNEPTRFLTFIGGRPVGTDSVLVVRNAQGWTITSTGSVGAPLDLVTRTLQIRYDPDWKPLELTLDGTVRGQVFGLRIFVNGTTATAHLNNAGQATDRTDAITPDTLLAPNPFLAAFEAATPRLMTAQNGASIPIYQGGGAPIVLRVGASDPERIQTVSRLLAARRTQTVLSAPGAEVAMEIWSDESGRLLRISVPTQQLEYVREDVASVSSRRVVISRPGDEQVLIPANGFNLAGTASQPSPAAARNPAVVLVAGSGPVDRDSTVAGIPVFGQLAGALADAGFAVLRYDKRGVGQSGGRVESAALTDYAEDVRAAVKFMGARKNVDSKRIAVVGHSEGGAAALIAASRDNRIAAVVLLGTPGFSGADVILAQQKRALDQLQLSDADRQARVDLQKQIHQAVISGKGWESLPPQLRRQVDTPEFQSFLMFDAATIMPKVRQPILVMQGALDTQVEPANAERLASLARSRKRPAPVETATIPGVNHLFVPATTGEVAEYTTLADKQITPALGSTIASWLQKTLPAPR
jgi:pimeloyl-ACP methyl ester carboxylesterase